MGISLTVIHILFSWNMVSSKEKSLFQEKWLFSFYRYFFKSADDIGPELDTWVEDPPSQWESEILWEIDIYADTLPLSATQRFVRNIKFLDFFSENSIFYVKNASKMCFRSWMLSIIPRSFSVTGNDRDLPLKNIFCWIFGILWKYEILICLFGGV